MMQHHNYALSDLDYMMPWEREIYVTQLIQFLKEEEERNKLRK
jgi:hypothetical protein